MSLNWIRIATFAGICACGPSTGVGDDSSGEGGSSTSGSDAGSTSTNATTVGEATSATVGSTVGSSTLDTSGTTGACDMADDGDKFPGGGEFDVGPAPPECDLFAQDCDAGEKCVPDWFATRVCEPIAPDPIPDGEPCDDGGDDPCGAGSWCGPTDSQGNGTCVPLCTGTPADPICPPDTICVMDDEGIVAYCQAPCDPFADAPCPGSTSCQPTAQGFGCIEEGGHLQNGACVENDSCIDGLYCADGALVEGCCFDRCCTTLCSDDHPCDSGTCHPLPGQVPGPEGLGFCG
jgi:hypothetical protein